MFGSAIIVFREVLEAALILGLVLAATRGIPRRGIWVSAGVGAGVLLAAIVAFLAEYISAIAEGMGQELFNAAVLFTAVGMLTWHLVWMQKHGAEMARQVANVGRAISEGETPMHVLTIVVGLAVLREGAETVLFMHGMIAAGSQVMAMLSGALIGLLGGITIGFALYMGLLRIPSRYLFKVTGIMILLLAAGLAAQAASYLVQADILPAFGHSIWDTSSILSEQSVIGSILHILVGYDANPMGIQILFYLSTLSIIGLLIRIVNKQGTFNSSPAVAGIVFVIILATAQPGMAEASHKVYSPTVELGETELELRAHTTFDDDAMKDGQVKMIIEYGKGITDYWFTSVFAEIEKEQPSNGLEWEATAWENIFQLTEQGEYWVDLGLYLEYEYAHESYNNDKVEFKILLEKASGSIVNTLNVIFERELGSNANSEIETGYAWRSKWKIGKDFEPALEIYGSFEDVDGEIPGKQQDHRAGPVVGGEMKLGTQDKLGYEAGYLFGLTDGAPDGTLKFSIEYEF